MAFVWIKVRTRHASGPSNWWYEEVERPDDENPKKWLDKHVEHLAHEYNTGGEGYRGADAEYALPPREALEQHIRHLKLKLAVTNRDLERAEALIEEYS